VPTSADRGCHVVSVTDPYGRILGFLDRITLLLQNFSNFVSDVLLLIYASHLHSQPFKIYEYLLYIDNIVLSLSLGPQSSLNNRNTSSALIFYELEQ
jgi:hypothetical protein